MMVVDIVLDHGFRLRANSRFYPKPRCLGPAAPDDCSRRGPAVQQRSNDCEPVQANRRSPLCRACERLQGAGSIEGMVRDVEGRRNCRQGHFTLAGLLAGLQVGLAQRNPT